MFSIFFIVGFSCFAGIAIAILITRKEAPGAKYKVIIEQDAERDPKEVRALTLIDLTTLGSKMLEENNLILKQEIPNKPGDVYWVAENTSTFFEGNYVIGFFVTDNENPLVTLRNILNFKDFLKGLDKAKGLFLTTGYFAAEVRQPLEGPKVTLYNRLNVLSELKARGLLQEMPVSNKSP